ncbi:Uncharacterised protein [Chlamydia abortus]|nr:Uncharacterised protein [Chlamydia abortus]
MMAKQKQSKRVSRQRCGKGKLMGGRKALSEWDNSQKDWREIMMAKQKLSQQNNSLRFIEESYRRIFKYSV